MSRGLSRQQVGILLAMRQREEKYEAGVPCLARYWEASNRSQCALDCGSTLGDIVQILFPGEWPIRWTWGRNRSLWRAVQSLHKRGLVDRLRGRGRRWRCGGHVYVTHWHSHTAPLPELPSRPQHVALVEVKC